MSKLVGTNGDELSLKVRQDQLVEFDVSLTLCNWMLPVPVRLATTAIGGLDISKLEGLLKDKNSEEFRLCGENICVSIYVGTWGIRSSFIVECVLSSVGWDDWPDRERISEYLLDWGNSAALLHSAFAVSDAELEQFTLGLARRLKQLEHD